jgi:hypothetical protein
MNEIRLFRSANALPLIETVGRYQTPPSSKRRAKSRLLGSRLSPGVD